MSIASNIGITPPAWMERAECVVRAEEPDRFFPDSGERNQVATARTRAICNNVCPVKTQCLKYALENGERYGIWGGVTEKQLRQMQKRKGQAA